MESSRTLCTECLLEDASFDDGDTIGVPCGSEGCEFRGCMYPAGDSAAQQACYESTARDVECESNFRTVTDCASVCE